MLNLKSQLWIQFLIRWLVHERIENAHRSCGQTVAPNKFYSKNPFRDCETHLHLRKRESSRVNRRQKSVQNVTRGKELVTVVCHLLDLDHQDVSDETPQLKTNGMGFCNDFSFRHKLRDVFENVSRLSFVFLVQKKPE